MPQIKDLIDKKFGKLTVIKFAELSWEGRALWLCKCDCGEEVTIGSNSLQTGNTKSCGCFQRNCASKMCKERIGENNPCYIDGRRSLIKENIRKHDNYICQECGKTQEECLTKYGRILDVHHIDNDNTNNAKKNMTALCHSCHSKIKNN